MSVHLATSRKSQSHLNTAQLLSTLQIDLDTMPLGELLQYSENQSSSSSDHTMLPRIVHVRQFPEHCTQDQIRQAFAEYGEIVECLILHDSYAFVHFGTPQDARVALQATNNQIGLLGSNHQQPLLVQYSRSKFKQTSSGAVEQSSQSTGYTTSGRGSYGRNYTPPTDEGYSRAPAGGYRAGRRHVDDNYIDEDHDYPHDDDYDYEQDENEPRHNYNDEERYDYDDETATANNYYNNNNESGNQHYYNKQQHYSSYNRSTSSSNNQSHYYNGNYNTSHGNYHHHHGGKNGTPYTNEMSSNYQQTSGSVRTKLYITNFPEDMDQEEMKQVFNQYGHVLECTIMWNQYAFVHFGSYEEAEKAMNATKGFLNLFECLY